MVNSFSLLSCKSHKIILISTLYGILGNSSFSFFSDSFFCSLTHSCNTVYSYSTFTFASLADVSAVALAEAEEDCSFLIRAVNVIVQLLIPPTSSYDVTFLYQSKSSSILSCLNNAYEFFLSTSCFKVYCTRTTFGFTTPTSLPTYTTRVLLVINVND